MCLEQRQQCYLGNRTVKEKSHPGMSMIREHLLKAQHLSNFFWWICRLHTFFHTVPDSFSFLCRCSLFPLPLEWEREILSFCLSLSNEPSSTALSLLSICSVCLTTLPSQFSAVSFCPVPLLWFLSHILILCVLSTSFRSQCSCRGCN